MKRYVVWCGVVLLAVAPLRAQPQAPPASKVILDLWDAAYLDGAKCGSQHLTVEQTARTVKRFSAPPSSCT